MRFANLSAVGVCLLSVLALSSPAQATSLSFDDAIAGATSYSFDNDGDGLADAIFFTTDPLGFKTIGPGPNMSYINEPGLEGTAMLSPDLRVDFPVGCIGDSGLSFGFALNTFSSIPNGMTFTVYDAGGTQLAQVYELAIHTFPDGVTRSSHPEAMVNTGAFPGIASYATFDFEYTPGLTGRYIIDNFTGQFATTEVIPEPVTLIGVMMAIGGVGAYIRKRRLAV